MANSVRFGVTTVLTLLLSAACGDDAGAGASSGSAGGAVIAAGTGAKPPTAASAGTSAKPPTGASGTGAPTTGGAAGRNTATPTAGTSTAGAIAAPTAGTGAVVSAGSGGAAPAASGAGAAAAPSTGCDRACLLAHMQVYVDALLAKDPTKLKVSSSLKYTENGVVSELGDTVWMTAMMAVPDTRLDMADPVLGNVNSMFVFNESNNQPVIYMVRLKVVMDEITEIETMAVRRQGAANGFFNVMNMKPEPVFLQEIPAEKRMSRDELKAITELYLDYLEGKKRGSEVPFDMGCKRYENGQVTADGLSSFNGQSWSFQVTRRILVIDEEAGITWGMFPFFQTESTLVVGEAFKIIDGKIMMIQAVMANQPAKVWD
jgi:hypothetical protein